MAKRIQPSFAKGELSPSLYGRVDTSAYQIGLRTARNAIVHTYGGISGKPGSKWLAPVKDHTYAPRLINFQFGTSDSYILEFGDFYMRVIRDDGHVIEAALKATIEGATQADPVVITSTAHGFLDGETVLITVVNGMTELNNVNFTAANVTANTFELSGIDGTSFDAYLSGGIATRILDITGATQTDPVVLTIPNSTLSDGDEVFITGILGMTELNTNRYIVTNSTSSTIELTSQVDGTDIDGTSFTAYISGGFAGKIYEIVTLYSVDDLFEIAYTQSADVMTLTNNLYPIQELSRTDHDEWSLVEPVFGPTIEFPEDITVTPDTPAAETQLYRVTAISTETGEESLPGADDNEITITGATQAFPVVITAAAHGFLNGDEILITDIVGMTELNDRRFTVNNEATNTFELLDEDGSLHTAYISGGIARTTFTRITDGNATIDNDLSWSAVTDADRYSVYRFVSGTYGLIGETTTTTFTDDNFTPDTSETPPIANDPFEGVLNKPGAVSFFEQRRVFGGTLNNPDTSFFSQIGNTSNFNTSLPLRADDAITATLNSTQVNEIRHYIPGNDLLAFTSGAEWRINSGPDSAFGPDTIKQKEQTTWGTSFRRPLRIGTTTLYVEENDSRVRSLGYSLQIDGYTGPDLSLLSEHLLESFRIVDWCSIASPESRVFMVRDDGDVLTLSFEKDQEVIAWTRWDTSGFYESCASELGGGKFSEDSVYFVVQRLINGQTVRYIEVVRQTPFSDVRDVFCVDSGLTFDNPIAITGITTADPVVITAPSHGLSDGDVINLSDIIWVPDEDFFGDEVQPTQLNNGRYTVANSTTDTIELSGVDGSAFNAYASSGFVRLTVIAIGGLSHLEGRTVSVLADGNVVTSKTVTDSVLTLDRSAGRIHVGLPFIVDIETLDMTSDQSTIQGLKKKVSEVTVRFKQSRGLWIGPTSDQLVEMKQREFELLGEPTNLLTGDKTITLLPDWNSNGRIFLRQNNPLPITILAVIPDVTIEEDEE